MRPELLRRLVSDRMGRQTQMSSIRRGERLRRIDDECHGRPQRTYARELPALAPTSPEGPVAIRVLVAEDMHVVRRALVALLELEDDIEVVAELGRGDEVLTAAVDLRPDVAVLDIGLPGTDGLTIAQELHERVPDCHALVLTALDQPGHLLRALEAHVRGYVVKDAPSESLVNGIRRVVAGERVIDPELVAAAIETGHSPLTAREADVLRAAATGDSTAAIATQLHLSPATVRNYLSNAMTKLGARNRIDAIRIARETDWLSS